MKQARHTKPVFASAQAAASTPRTTASTRHESGTPSSVVSMARRADSALRPSTPLEVLVSRAVDQELEWYFSYAESGLAHDSVGMLPSYAVARILADAASATKPRRRRHLGEPADDVLQARAYELGRTVRECLHALPGRHASVLRAVYTPRRWPKAVLSAFDVLTPVAVRLAFAEDPWPPRLSAHAGLEEAAACRLSAALHDPAKVKVAKLKARAARLFGKAVAAYSKARASALVPTLEGA
jgi:hypothetical protein